MRSSDARRRARGGLPARPRVPALAAAAAAWLLVVALPAIVFAADPTSTPGGEAGDPRSSGQGPGLVGDPGWAIAAVLLIGVTTVLVTLAYVRLTARRGPRTDR